MYSPSRTLSIDEQMVGTKSRISFLQYMTKKPKKFGVTLWALCEALSGYCLQFQVYTGKSQEGTENGLTHHVVFDLIKSYLYKGYRGFLISMIIDYNTNMSGVDKCYQYLSYYTIGRKSSKTVFPYGSTVHYQCNVSVF